MNDSHNSKWPQKIELSAILTILGIILLFSTAIIVTLIAPNYVDPTWTSPTTPYQVQMYEIEDPHLYLSSASSDGRNLQYVQHLKQKFTLIAFKESSTTRFISTPELESFITRADEPMLKLTSRLLMLRQPEGEMLNEAERLRNQIDNDWESQNPNWKAEGKVKLHYQVLELYDPHKEEAFSLSTGGEFVQNWVDQNFVILDEVVQQPYHKDYGVVYVLNPTEFRVTAQQLNDRSSWRYDPGGKPVENLEALKALKFYSRKELISYGEHIYAIEGCWYCHTDQTRTLIQDLVLNGSESFPAPPSSANEYIYQEITFPGTRRIGPDISRVGIKRPSRDWHKAHFWAPKTASKGSIMPAFQHFFDEDPRGTSREAMGIPNHEFEAIYQYLMTKGTRITPPTQAWWLGKDYIQTKEIIEGLRTLP